MLLSIALAMTTMTSSFDVGGVKVILREPVSAGWDATDNAFECWYRGSSARGFGAWDKELSQGDAAPQNVAAWQ
jgi:hypothetical protein